MIREIKQAIEKYERAMDYFKETSDQVKLRANTMTERLSAYDDVAQAICGPHDPKDD